MSEIARTRAAVLGVPIDALSWQDTLDRLRYWAERRESRYVCTTNVHALLTALRDEEFGRIVANADLATPDGAPVAWMLRKLGFPDQQRIAGPDLMWKYCEQAAQRGEPILLYGGTEETLAVLQQRLYAAFPDLLIADVISPPFLALSPEEDAADIARINASGAGTVWVSLGCPKQEAWMAAHRGRIHAVMIGVGAAFEYHAGIIRRAPLWMQETGLEWFHRLCSEPRRLWKRYLVTNTLFLLGAARQLLSRRDRRRD